MTGLPNYFERAADALWLAMGAPTPAEEDLHLEEALRLNSVALGKERAKLAKKGLKLSHPNPARVGLEPIEPQAWMSPRRH